MVKKWSPNSQQLVIKWSSSATNWSKSGYQVVTKFTKWSPVGSTHWVPIGHQVVTKNSSRGHQMVTNESPRGHQIVTKGSPNSHQVVTKFTKWSPNSHQLVIKWSQCGHQVDMEMLWVKTSWSKSLSHWGQICV